ncbi:thioredoxin [Planctobacterium marinum]|uniref:Thioredoxin n=1 Tax=Planctobacterium marinum TaxID=1631968 RepID=A0AA48HN76_9ALTE|nr:co-chaperone YbbN [Planctobacterium marinum]
MEQVTSNIVNMTPDNFQQIVLEESQQRLVMIDFWADWCEPCKSLMPVLEKIAAEYPQDLLLAKVNCDEQQAISMQFGVRNLPTVILVKDGQPIDGFAGAQPEGEIRALLEKHLPKVEDGLLTNAGELMAEGKYDEAFPLLKTAFETAPDRTDIKFALIHTLLELGRLAQAKELLDSVMLVDQDADYQTLKGKLELAEKASQSPEILALEETVDKNPEDLQAKVDLAVQYQQNNRQEEGLALLLKVLQRDINFGDAKKLMIDTINALPEGDSLAATYRRKLYAMLY